MCSSIEHSPIMILASGHPDPLDSRDNQSIPDPASSLHSAPQGILRTTPKPTSPPCTAENLGNSTGTYGEDLNTSLILASRLFCLL